MSATVTMMVGYRLEDVRKCHSLRYVEDLSARVCEQRYYVLDLRLHHLLQVCLRAHGGR